MSKICTVMCTLILTSSCSKCSWMVCYGSHLGSCLPSHAPRNSSGKRETQMQELQSIICMLFTVNQNQVFEQVSNEIRELAFSMVRKRKRNLPRFLSYVLEQDNQKRLLWSSSSWKAILSTPIRGSALPTAERQWVHILFHTFKMGSAIMNTCKL